MPELRPPRAGLLSPSKGYFNRTLAARRRIHEQLAIELASKELKQLGGSWGGAWSSVPAWWATMPELTKDTFLARVSDGAIERRVLDETGA